MFGWWFANWYHDFKRKPFFNNDYNFVYCVLKFVCDVFMEWFICSLVIEMFHCFGYVFTPVLDYSGGALVGFVYMLGY